MNQETRESAESMARILAEKKALDVELIDISAMTIIADAFVIASGRSMVQTRALCDELEEKAGKPLRMEGYAAGRWIMLDYGAVVVHVFHREDREFYDLERLWDQGNNITRFE